MPGLLDIIANGRTVSIKGGDVRVGGVSARGVASLMARFPEFRRLMTGNGIDLSPESLGKMVPEAIAAVIAAGIGKPGDKATEEAADVLPLESQAMLLEAIIDETMPNGVGPFVEMLNRVGARFGVTVTNTAATKSPQRAKP